MRNFEDLDNEEQNRSPRMEEEREKEELMRKRIMRSKVIAEDGKLHFVYSEREDGDIWCHICNNALFGGHKLLTHNIGNRHKIQLEKRPYPVLLWSKRSDIVKNYESRLDTLVPGEPIPPGLEDQISRATSIQISLERYRNVPLVGLEYLLELVDPHSTEPSYTCVICDKRGDPRTVMAHITSYNHRIAYLKHHFPTISRAIADLPRTDDYKRGANEISLLVAKRIEQHFGRLQPQLVDQKSFERNKEKIIKRIYRDYHFRETRELTFMEVFDVRWATHFKEKMAELNSKTLLKKDEPKFEKAKEFKPDPKRKDSNHKIKINLLAKDKLIPKRANEKSAKTDKLKRKTADQVGRKSLSSLSSTSSSPSPKRLRCRSNEDRSSVEIDKEEQPARGPSSLARRWFRFKAQAKIAKEMLDQLLMFHVKNPEKHPAYKIEWKKFWNRRYKELRDEGKDPNKHDYKPEWIEFWNKRMRELHSEQVEKRKEEIKSRLDLIGEMPKELGSRQKSPDGHGKKRKATKSSDDAIEVEYVATLKRNGKFKYNPLVHDRDRARETETGRDRDRDSRHQGPYRDEDRIQQRDEISDRDRNFDWDQELNRQRHRVTDRSIDRDRSWGRLGEREVLIEYFPSQGRDVRGEAYQYYYAPPARPRYHATPYPVVDRNEFPTPPRDDEELEIIGLLRLLTALEIQLGSLGPKVVSLLSHALAAEKFKPNSAEELLFDDEVSVLFETVKEKLKGRLFAGMIEKVAIPATKNAIQNIARLLFHAMEAKKKMEEEKKNQKEIVEQTIRSSLGFMARTLYPSLEPSKKSEPVSVPRVSIVDKIAIAQQIAAALIAQGKTNVTNEELDTLTNAVVGMAEVSKNSDKPVTTADFVKGLISAYKADPTPEKSPAQSVTTTVPEPVKALSSTSVKSVSTTSSSTVNVENVKETLNTVNVEDVKETVHKISESLSTKITDLDKSVDHAVKMENLSDSDLKADLKNDENSSTDEQHGLINLFKELEGTDSAKAEKLRTYSDTTTVPEPSLAPSPTTIPLISNLTSGSTSLSSTVKVENLSEIFNTINVEKIKETLHDISESLLTKVIDHDEPVDHAVKLENLSDSDLKALLQNFKSLASDEQQGLINFFKKLEATDSARVEKLRAYSVTTTVHEPVQAPSPASIPLIANVTSVSTSSISTVKVEKSSETFNTINVEKMKETLNDISESIHTKITDLDKPVDHAVKMENLSDSDLKALLQNFKNLSSDEQQGLINFFKKLEATDSARVEKLRAYYCIEHSPSPAKKPVCPLWEKGTYNPCDDKSKWKPLDIVVDVEEEKRQQPSEPEIVLSDDDDDYSFDDIYKAANENVKEIENFKKLVMS